MVNYFVIHLRHEFHSIGLIQLISMNKRKIFCVYITGSINVNKKCNKIIGLIRLHKLCKINKLNTRRTEKNNFARKCPRESIGAQTSYNRYNFYKYLSNCFLLVHCYI
jgi:hypothetical protein